MPPLPPAIQKPYMKYMNEPTSKLDESVSHAPPPLHLLIKEVRYLPDLVLARRRPVTMHRHDVGNDAPVMTLPGFCANDDSMKQMRFNLNAAGFAAKRWKLGRNLGARLDTIERIDARVKEIAEEAGRPVNLVGWSLGGVMAREYARQHPDHVASVVTMGSPFSGSLKANHAWRLYQLVAGHKIDAMPMPVDPTIKPPVPTYALWSSRDGVIAINSARGQPDQSDVIREVDCGHLGFAFEPKAIDAVIDCLIAAREANALASSTPIPINPLETRR